MKRANRNRLLAAAAAAVSSFLLLSGFDSALTVQDVISRGQEAMKDMNSISAQMTGVADVVLDMTAGEESNSIPLKGDMDLQVQMTFEPFAYHVGGTMSGDASALGMAGEMGMDMYMVTAEDGTGTIYVSISGIEGEEGWQAIPVSAESMQEMAEMIEASRSGDLTAASEKLGMDLQALQDQMFENAELAPEAVSVNGADCYEISIPVTGDMISNIMSQLAASNAELGLDESTISIAQMFLSPLKMDIVQDYAVDTFRPVYVGYDMAGRDFSMLAQMVGALMFTSGEDSTEAAPDISLTVNALNMSGVYNDEPVEIVVPEEALNAPMAETELELYQALEEAA